jgi:hypothetical protein
VQKWNRLLFEDEEATPSQLHHRSNRHRPLMFPECGQRRPRLTSWNPLGKVDQEHPNIRVDASCHRVDAVKTASPKRSSGWNENYDQ